MLETQGGEGLAWQEGYIAEFCPPPVRYWDNFNFYRSAAKGGETIKKVSSVLIYTPLN